MFSKYLFIILIAAGLFLVVQKAGSQVLEKPSLDDRLERERLAALPALKAQLQERSLRERADMVIILNEGFFNTMLAELSSQKFDAAGLFSVMIQNPRILLKNGLALVRMDAQLLPSGQLLKVTARLLVEKGQGEALIAKFQVVELKPTGEKESALSSVSPEQLSSLLPPFTLPLDFNFDHNIQFGSMKQSKPVAVEIEAEPRRISGHFEVIGLLPLEGRLAVFTRAEDLSVQ
jgi:hypothetical protein